MAKQLVEESGTNTNIDLSILKRDIKYLQERIERETPINLNARLSMLEKSLLVLENNAHSELPKINELKNEIGIVKQKQSDFDRNMKYYLILVGVITSLLTIIAMMFGTNLGGK